MKQNFNEHLKNNYWLFNRVALFVVAAVAMVFIFPRQGKFESEYQLGSPWRHNDLIAEFAFRIHKSETELARERDSILLGFKPYFNYQIEVGHEQIKKFKSAFEQEWKEYTIAKFGIENLQDYEASSRYKIQRQLGEKYLDLIAEQLLKIYDIGIVDIPDQINQQQIEAIVVVKFNIAEEESLGNIFTQKTAYQYIHNNLSGEILNDKNSLIKRYNDFFENLLLDRFISINLYYDEVRSNEVKQTILDQLSPYKGGLQEGQSIINRGDMITESKFKVLESYRIAYENNLGKQEKFYVIQLGKFLMLLACLVVLFLFLLNFRHEILIDFKKSFFILFLLLAFVGVAGLWIRLDKFDLYFLPFALLPLLLRTFFDARLAMFVHFIAILIIGEHVPNGFEFIFLNFIAGNVAIFSLTNSNRRRKIVFTSLFVILAYSITELGFIFSRAGKLNYEDLVFLRNFSVNGLLLFVSVPLIYIFEKIFGFVSDATLLELSDTNQPLLRKLAETAPGTFQHSLQVANIAEEAIHHIGGNALLVRTGALYHDIGKMANPIYFIENQSSEMNPHEKLEYAESAKIIIGHVTKGVETAKKYKLPEIIIDFIRTHHGTSTVQYFYRNHLKTNPESEVNIKDFTYPGPKPYSKETAILMMADSVEAASRSLGEINEETINNLVDNIINYQQVEEQFNDADITYKDISIAKSIFKKRLKEIYHARIAYPKA